MKLQTARLSTRHGTSLRRALLELSLATPKTQLQHGPARTGTRHTFGRAAAILSRGRPTSAGHTGDRFANFQFLKVSFSIAFQ